MGAIASAFASNSRLVSPAFPVWKSIPPGNLRWLMDYRRSVRRSWLPVYPTSASYGTFYDYRVYISKVGVSGLRCLGSVHHASSVRGWGLCRGPVTVVCFVLGSLDHPSTVFLFFLLRVRVLVFGFCFLVASTTSRSIW